MKNSSSLVGGLLALSGVLSGALSCSGAPERQEWTNTWDGDGEDLFLVDDDFVCLGDARWQQVGHSRLWNPLGHQQAAVEHASTKSLGAYPVGTVIQLFPEEASVKRGKGFDDATADWEFFKLAADDDGNTVIVERGTADIGNPAGTCIGCHAGANAYDYACFSNAGCGALPPFVDTDLDPETEDPRCR